MTESNAVARYIARKNGLDGETEQEKVIIDMFENLTYNFHIDLARVCYGPEFVITELLFYPYLISKGLISTLRNSGEEQCGIQSQAARQAEAVCWLSGGQEVCCC